MKLSVQILVTAILLAGRVVAQTPSGFSPATNSTLDIKYGATAVGSGGSVALDKTTASPALWIPSASANHSHIVVMVDLDSPGGANNNSYSPFLHWLTPVEAGLTSLPDNESVTDAVFPYASPAPPAGTGPHRYVVLLFTDASATFKMPSSFQDLDPTNIYDRAVFNVEKFAEEGGFQLQAANWFTTQNRTVIIPVAAAPKLAGGVTTSFFGLACLCSLAWGLF